MPNQNYQFSTDPGTAEIKAETTMSNALNNINRQILEEKTTKNAKALGLPYVDILDAPINPDLIWQIDFAESETALALPFFAIGRRWRVAVSDPERAETKSYLERLKKERYQVQVNLASQDGIQLKLKNLADQKPRQLAEEENQNAEMDLQSYEEEINKLKALAEDAYNLSAEESLNRIFVGALRTGASDIHFQFGVKSAVVRFRIDGILQQILEFSSKIGNQIVDQLKYKAQVRMNVRNIPQDGRTSFQAAGRKIDIRVSTLPTEYGESVVCRLLDSGKGIISFRELGFAGASLRRLEPALKLRSGLILVTGPTGSGKTTTLYTMLDQLNTPGNKVATLEDPVEYHLPDIVQSQISEEEGYSFASGLRALLRQDPDVIMIGEIRDQETAETAAQAAMTGHIVLSTLHTNSALEVVPRLINIGLKPFVLASSLSLVLAQRLVRKVHKDCAEQSTPTPVQRSLLSSQLAGIKKIDPETEADLPEVMYEPKGCPACSHTGYRGQVAIVESYTLTDSLREIILRGATTAELLQHVRSEQKMLSFAQDGILKVCAGETTFSEIARVAGVLGIK